MFLNSKSKVHLQVVKYCMQPINDPRSSQTRTSTLGLLSVSIVGVPNRQPIIHGERRGTGHVRDFVTPSRNRKCFPPANGYSYVMGSWIKLGISGVQSSVNIQRVP